MSVEVQEEVELLELEELIGEQQIVLFNDDVNTFDFVIDQLVKYCKHQPIQAEHEVEGESSSDRSIGSEQMNT